MPGNDVTRDLLRLQRSRKAEIKRIEERTSKLVETNKLLEAEVRARERAEKETRLLLTLIETIENAKDFRAALDLTLQTVCKFTSWDYGEAWILNEDKSALVLTASWHKEEDRLAHFVSSTNIHSFPLGVGLPGRVWACRQAEWAPDLAQGTGKTRLPLLLKAGVKSSAGFPVMAAEEIIAVLVFFMLEKREAVEHQIEVVGAVAAQLGSAIHRKRIEDEALRHHALLQAVMDNSTRIVYVKDPQGRYITVNREFENRHEITRDAIRGKTDHDLFPKDTADAFRANDVKVLRSAIPMEFEETIDYEDGRHSFMSNKFPILDSLGGVYAVCGISTDITEQKRQQENLRSARDHLSEEVRIRTAELIEANQALFLANKQKDRALEELQKEKDFSANLLNTAQVIVLLLDTGGRVVYFNPFFEKLTGYSLEESKGKDWFLSFLRERDRQHVRVLFDAAMRGRAVALGINSILCRNGKEREIEWSATNLRGADGRLVGLLCSGLDVSERQRAETRFETLFNTMDDGWVSIDARGDVTVFNPAAERVFGYTAKEIIGRSLKLIIPNIDPLDPEASIARHRTNSAQRAINRLPGPMGKRKDGEPFPIEMSVTRVSNDSGMQYAALIRDVSEKVRLQEQAVENERLAMIGMTASKFGHELANPLNGMSLTIQLLEQMLKSQTTVPDHRISSVLKRLKNEITRLSHLVQEFRILYQKQKYDFRSTALTPLLEDVTAMQQPLCASLGIAVERRLEKNLPTAVIDGDKIKQAVLNLFKNAVESMPRGGRLSLEARAADGDVIIEVSDTGAGIPPGTDVFMPFFTTKDQGTGLGLIIVRQILALHGGTISYHSEPGKGTTFCMTLPLNRPESDEAFA